MVGLVAVKVELDVQGLPAPPLPGDALEHAGVPAKVDAEVKADELLQVKVETKSEFPGERHLAMKRAAVKAELRAGGLPTHGSAEDHTARLAEHGHGWTEPVKAGHLVQREQVVHGAAAGRGVPAATPPAEDTDTDADGVVWECENGCGFRGTFSTVDTHEAMCSHQRTPHPQPKLNPKMSAPITKAVNAAFGALVAQLDKLCHRRDNRVKCATALIALLADHVHDLKDPEQIAAARREQKKSAKQTFEVRLKKKA
jgi:hypothetical protein